METKELHSRIVCGGVIVGKTTREQILEIQNPLKQKRGGLGYGLYAMMKASNDSQKLLANINAYAADSDSSIRLIITDLAKRQFSLLDSNEVVGEGAFFAPDRKSVV